MKKLLSAFTISLPLLLGACSGEQEQVEQVEIETLEQQEKQNEAATAHLETIKQFIQIAYFDEGTYDEFVALHADPTMTNTEEEFNTFRESTTAEDQFPVDSDSVANMLKHLVAISIDESHAEVYWVEDKEKATKEDAAYVWQLVETNGAWQIQ